MAMFSVVRGPAGWVGAAAGATVVASTVGGPLVAGRRQVLDGRDQLLGDGVRELRGALRRGIGDADLHHDRLRHDLRGHLAGEGADVRVEAERRRSPAPARPVSWPAARRRRPGPARTQEPAARSLAELPKRSEKNRLLVAWYDGAVVNEEPRTATATPVRAAATTHRQRRRSICRYSCRLMNSPRAARRLIRTPHGTRRAGSPDAGLRCPHEAKRDQGVDGLTHGTA